MKKYQKYDGYKETEKTRKSTMYKFKSPKPEPQEQPTKAKLVLTCKAKKITPECFPAHAIPRTL